MTLAMSDRTRLRILVIPPGFTPQQGEEALLAAATRRNGHSASELLAEVRDQPVADALNLWDEDGGHA